MDDGTVERQLREAYRVVEAAGIQGESLRLEAFKVALQAIGRPHTAKLQPEVVHPVTDVLTPDTARLAVVEPAANAASPYQAIATALDIPLDVAELFYVIDDDTVMLNIPPKILARTASAAMREIAILLTVGSKHAGISDGVSFTTIRNSCMRMGRLDKRNFAAVINAMKPGLTASGQGGERVLIAKGPADGMARGILMRYAQASGL